MLNESPLFNQASIGSVWAADTQQSVFRELMDAMARPGKIVSLAMANVAPLNAILATLLDKEVTLCDHANVLIPKDWPLLQAYQATADTADFIVCDGTLAPDFQPKLGTLASPDFSATLIIFVTSLVSGSTALHLTGPGIKDNVSIHMDGFHLNWLIARDDWNSAFPIGVDIFLADDTHIMALPRTTKMEVVR